MSRLLRSCLAASLRLGLSLAALFVLGACGETLTAPPLVNISEDSTALAPQDPGQLCVDYVTDDTPLTCIVRHGSNRIVFPPEANDAACTCTLWAIQP